VNSELTHSTITIERNGASQVEAMNGDTASWSVKWINDCEYELRYLGMTENSRGTIDKYLRNHTLRTKILKAERNFYVFELSIEGVEMKVIDTMTIYKR